MKGWQTIRWKLGHEKLFLRIGEDIETKGGDEDEKCTSTSHKGKRNYGTTDAET